MTTGELRTPAEAAELLRVRESWLRAKAAARAIPCTFIGKHLRFSDHDISQIMHDGARPALASYGHRPSGQARRRALWHTQRDAARALRRGG